MWELHGNHAVHLPVCFSVHLYFQLTWNLIQTPAKVVGAGMLIIFIDSLVVIGPYELVFVQMIIYWF